MCVCIFGKGKRRVHGFFISRGWVVLGGLGGGANIAAT